VLGHEHHFLSILLPRNTGLRATMIVRKFENNRVRVVDAAPYFLNTDNSVKVIASDRSNVGRRSAVPESDRWPSS
jgi:hypothetical protein